jgi:hypothetical protein
MKLGLEAEVLNIQTIPNYQLHNPSLFLKLVDLGTPSKVAISNSQFLNPLNFSH